MHSDFLIFLLIWLFVCLGFALLIGISVGLDYWWQREVGCPRVAKELGLEYKFDYWASGSGCFIQIENGKWVDASRYAGIVIDAPFLHTPSPQ